MPGAYAHITMAFTAAHPDVFEKLGLDDSDAGNLLQNISFFQLGAVSPDMPYLVGMGSDARSVAWANCMHHEAVAERIRAGVAQVRSLPGTKRYKCLAWLLGFLEHVVFDVFMHPVVNEIAGGPYSESTKAKHQLSEMHQDVYIVKNKFDIHDITGAGIVNTAIKHLHEAGKDKFIDEDIHSVWDYMLRVSTHKFYTDNTPDINSWYHSFVGKLNLQESHPTLVNIGRHMGVKLIYPALSSLDDAFTKEVPPPKTPKKDYVDLFDAAQEHVVAWWGKTLDAVLKDVPFEETWLQDWNLDTGCDTAKHCVFWGQI
jgi:hypothetical protein